jgi:hypothetical protein
MCNVAWNLCFSQQMPSIPDPAAQAKEYERQDLEKEAKIDNDDAETVQKAREWDDWKDGTYTLCKLQHHIPYIVFGKSFP